MTILKIEGHNTGGKDYVIACEDCHKTLTQRMTKKIAEKFSPVDVTHKCPLCASMDHESFFKGEF